MYFLISELISESEFNFKNRINFRIICRIIFRIFFQNQNYFFTIN